MGYVRSEMVPRERLAQRSASTLLHRTYIGIIERGENAVTIVTANKIAGALGMTLAGLFTELERGREESTGG